MTAADDAYRASEQIASDAQRRARAVLYEADRRARSLVEDACDRALAILAEAREVVESLAPPDALAIVTDLAADRARRNRRTLRVVDDAAAIGQSVAHHPARGDR